MSNLDPRNYPIAFTYWIFILGAFALFFGSPLSPTSHFNSSSNVSFDYIAPVSAQGLLLPPPPVQTFPPAKPAPPPVQIFPPAKSMSPAEPVSSAQDHVPGQTEFIVAASQPTTGESLLDIIFRNQGIFFTGVFVSLVTAIVTAITISHKYARTYVSLPAIIMFLFGVILFGVIIVEFFISPGGKAEGGAAFLSPPGPACPPTPKRASAKTAIVLIHGWNGGADTTWSKFPDLLCQDEAFSDTEVFVVNYPTYMVRRQLHIGSLARWLRQTFFSDALRNYEDIHIIAHSMGGLIARSVYIQDKLGGPSKIRSIISIASPYLGAEMAKLAGVLGLNTDLTEDMVPDSVFLQTLADNWTDTYPKPLTYCFTSPTDGIVSSLSAKSQCECTHDYPQWNHIEMVKPELITEKRYHMPVRGLKNTIAAGKLLPSAGRPQCFSLAQFDDHLKVASQR